MTRPDDTLPRRRLAGAATTTRSHSATCLCVCVCVLCCCLGSPCAAFVCAISSRFVSIFVVVFVSSDRALFGGTGARFPSLQRPIHETGQGTPIHHMVVYGVVFVTRVNPSREPTSTGVPVLSFVSRNGQDVQPSASARRVVVWPPTDGALIASLCVCVRHDLQGSSFAPVIVVMSHGFRNGGLSGLLG